MFKLYARLALAAVLSLLGFLLASSLPLPDGTTALQVKIGYTLLGFIFGIVVFSRIASWMVFHTTRLFRQLIVRIASEVIYQFSHLASSGMNLFGGARGAEGANLAPNGGSGTHIIIVDTSAIIDGRILDIAKTGFLYGSLIIPNFVLTELQQVSDSSDDIKRSRGRRGFEIIDELKKIPSVRVEIWDKLVKGSTVDDQLIRLGKILKGKILTTDFNLNRVARVSGVTVLNVNELANALKTVAVPGETMKIKIVHAGKDKNQGVGYLLDGTMIVVSEAAELLGEEIKVEVTRNLQVPTGRMIFAKLLS